MGILAVVAVGTWLVPPEVQVELRVGIAAVGLIVLVFFLGSLAFWLFLLGFGAMGALQVRHSDSLRMPPRHTMDWFKAMLDQARAAPTAAAAMDAAEEGEGPGATARAAAALGLAAVQGGLGTLAGTIGTSPGRLAASILAALVVLCIFVLPFVWVVVTVEFAGQSESESTSFTFREAAQQLEDEGAGGAAVALFVVLAAVAVAGIASAVLPRRAVMIVGLAGVAVTLVGYIYLLVEFFGFSESANGFSATVVTLPHVGSLIAGGCFLLTIVSQLIPALGKARA